jgi:hypothetical protein
MKLSKNKIIIITVVVLLLITVSVLIYTLNVSSNPPELYVKTNNVLETKCIKGGFKWNYLGGSSVADALSPTKMEYTEENTIYVNPSETLIFSNSSNYKMYNEDIRYYDEELKEQIITSDIASATTESKTVSFDAPKQLGTYILSITINYYDKGSVQYGVKVVVTYDVSSLEQYANTYVGDASKVSAILNLLPYGNYKNGIELITSKEPYGIITNYSNKDLSKSELEFNTLALFTLVQNVDNITYNIKSGDNIKTYTVTRNELKGKYNLTIEGLKNYISKKDKEYVQLENLSKEYTLKNAIEDNCFVWNIQEEYNREVLENFVSKVNNKQNAFIRIAKVTIEGDVIIEDVKYEDNIFKLTIDYTRDKFSSGSDRVYKNYTYSNIKITTGSDNDISSVILHNGNSEMHEVTETYIIYTNGY